MRIALVVERFEPGVGGVENAAWAMAHGLARAGDEVHVIARRAAPSRDVCLRRVQVPAAWRPLRALAFSHAAARAAPRGAFDVVYSLSRTRHQDVYRAGGGSHADYLAHRYHRAGGGLRRFAPRHAVLLSLERRIFADPTQLVQCSSEMVRSQIQRRYHVPVERLAVLPNGVDLETYHPRPRGEGARLREGLGGGAQPVWLFAGSGFARKGLDTALRALALAGSACGSLWVAGADRPGRWSRLARRLGVAERVAFLGFRRDLPRLYAAVDGLLLPTRYDGFGNVCLEAAATGIPVVTSAAAGAAPLVRGAGRVVADPEDAGAFAEALRELRDPRLRAALGAAGRRTAQAHGWDTHVAALRALLARARR
ncbi:MAG: glycosyltransferase family 4 protein [Myxococcota bacterium]